MENPRLPVKEAAMIRVAPLPFRRFSALPPCLLALACALFLAACAARAGGGFDVQPYHVLVEEPGLNVDVTLPRTGVPVVDARLRETTDELVRQAREAKIPPDTPWSREVFGEYDSSRAGGPVWSFLMTYGLFTGGAHPIPVVEALTFDLSTGKQIVFSDVFLDDQDSVEKLASYVMADLVNRQGLDADWVSGHFADPGKALSRFVLRESGPTFVFAPYEVAPYAWGKISVDLPWAALTDLVRPGLGSERN